MIQCPALKLHCRTPVIISSMNRPGDRYWHSNQGARCKVLDWLTRRNDKDEHAYTPKQIADAIGASHDAYGSCSRAGSPQARSGAPGRGHTPVVAAVKTTATASSTRSASALRTSKGRASIRQC